MDVVMTVKEELCWCGGHRTNGLPHTHNSNDDFKMITWDKHTGAWKNHKKTWVKGESCQVPVFFTYFVKGDKTQYVTGVVDAEWVGDEFCNIRVGTDIFTVSITQLAPGD